MANVLVEEQYLQDIADNIRAKNGTSDTYTPAQMANAISEISSGGGESGFPPYQILGTQVQLEEYKTYGYVNDSGSAIGSALSYRTSSNNWRIAKGTIQKDSKYICISRLNDSDIVNYIITDNDNIVLKKYKLASSSSLVQTFIDTYNLDDTNGLVLHVSYGKQDAEFALNQGEYYDFFSFDTLRSAYPVAVRKVNEHNTSGGILYDIIALLNGTCTQINDTNGDIKFLSKRLFYLMRVSDTDFNSSISLYLPQVQFIDNECFRNDSSTRMYSPIVSADLPNCVGIGGWAFQYCGNLTYINIPNVRTLGRSVFGYTGISGSFYLQYLEGVPEYCFDHTNITSISLPSATFLQTGCFSACTSLTSISAPNVKSIYKQAFTGCTSLQEVEFTQLEGYPSELIFENCTSLKKATLTPLTNYYSNWFKGCSSLEEVTLGNPNFRTVGSFPAAKSTLKKACFPNLTSMSATTLANFTVLETLVIGSNVDSVCTLSVADAFAGTPIADGTGYIYVPDDLVDSYKSATNWSTYADQIKGLSELPTE